MHNAESKQNTTPLPDGQDIASILTEFCDNTAAVAYLAQAMAVRFALIASRLQDGGDPALGHTLSQMSAAIDGVVKSLEDALAFTLLSITPKEQWGVAN